MRCLAPLGSPTQMWYRSGYSADNVGTPIGIVWWLRLGEIAICGTTNAIARIAINRLRRMPPACHSPLGTTGIGTAR
jgi:hypothetical protein